MGRRWTLRLVLGLLLASTARANENDDEEPVPPDAPAAVPAAGAETAVSGSRFDYVLVSSTPASAELAGLTASVEQEVLAPNLGYAPLRVKLINSAVRAQKVEVEFSPSEGFRPVSRAVELMPGEARTVVLPIPGSSSGKVEVTTPRGSVLTQHVYFDRQTGRRAVLVVGSAQQLSDLVGPPVTSRVNKVSVATFLPEDLPVELAAYAGFDAVVLPVVRLEDLQEAQARALEAYAATGGLLVLGHVGPGTAARLPDLGAVREESQAYAFGHVRVCGRNGKCGRLLADDLGGSQPVVRPAQATARLRYSRYGSGPYPPPPSARFLLPQASAPVGRFLLIIVLFTLAVGPGSLVVARRRGPAMLLFTIPATAAVTCAFIIVYSVVMDGFVTHARTLGLTLLDRRHDRALTVGLGAFYANLSPRGARFGTASAVLQPLEDSLGSTVNWTEGASFGGDFIPSRTYREFALLSVEPSRARLAVKRDGSRVRVQNALGGRIARAHVAVGGRLLEVKGVADGAEAIATDVTLPVSGEEQQEPLLRFDRRATERFGAEPPEGAFLALVDGPGSVPLGGLSVEHHDSQHLILGEVE